MLNLAMLLTRAIQVLIFSASGLHASEAGSSYTPIVGFDDKNGALFGAAAFKYQEGRPGYNHGLYGVTNGRDFHSLTLNLLKRSEAGLDLGLQSDFASAFDNYYGEGSQTSDKGGIRIAQDQMNAQASALWHGAGSWAMGPTLGLKARHEKNVQTRPVGQEQPVVLSKRAFGDSANPSVGLKAIFDNRDTDMSSTQGTLLSMDLRALPAALALMTGANDAWQAQAEWRQFQALGRGFVFAHRLSGGTSWGQPSYMERFNLGGTGLLRGFQDNRFRGKQFYCVQEELRIPIWDKYLSGATSVDLGDVGDGELKTPRRSVQAGLRIGLWPSFGMKARLDFGFGDGGESSMALQFGQTF